MTSLPPYSYRRTELVEPDWRRFPGWRDVTDMQWYSARWQRTHSVRNAKQLHAVLGDLLDDSFYQDMERDRAEHATMPLLLPPQMLNTIAPYAEPKGAASLTSAFQTDPVRRYMIPLASDRRTDWLSHPRALRDSLHEQEMWAVEGLVHRYPTKVLAEVLPTCPQYCGHCTRMDLVGTSTPAVDKLRFTLKPQDRLDGMVAYLSRSPQVRDVVISGGDVANMPWPKLERFINRLLDIDSIRDIRLASKALIGVPQHWLTDEIRAGMERVAKVARDRGVQLAIHTHANAAQSVTPLVARAARAMLETGIRDVRNQGVLLRGVNDSIEALLDLSFVLLDEAAVMPYYLYLCDMIPSVEHWRLSLAEAIALQDGIMGYLPGFATPRIVCDVPYVGKRWVHQFKSYDRIRGISLWEKNFRTPFEADEPLELAGDYEYLDPLYTLPPDGQDWWRQEAYHVLEEAPANVDLSY
ncbi:KamA family radical SAM protein [Streptomyces xiangluensis]|uniref:KamA family radical SAM protein n=1 Tax=Streptomyces xiangluensis TaxID=2665720 RepID=A0ABV8YLX1_9ACTN